MTKLQHAINQGLELASKHASMNYADYKQYIQHKHLFSVRTARNYINLHKYKHILIQNNITSIKQAYNFIKGIETDHSAETVSQDKELISLKELVSPQVEEIISHEENNSPVNEETISPGKQFPQYTGHYKDIHLMLNEFEETVSIYPERIPQVREGITDLLAVFV